MHTDVVPCDAWKYIYIVQWLSQIKHICLLLCVLFLCTRNISRPSLLDVFECTDFITICGHSAVNQCPSIYSRSNWYPLTPAPCPYLLPGPPHQVGSHHSTLNFSENHFLSFLPISFWVFYLKSGSFGPFSLPS